MANNHHHHHHYNQKALALFWLQGIKVLHAFVGRPCHLLPLTAVEIYRAASGLHFQEFFPNVLVVIYF
jgi:hypothetical protein